MVMVPDDPLAILKQIPENRHVHRQHNRDADFGVRKKMRMIFGGRRAAAHQFKNFNRDEKSRFANGQPDGPTRAESQPVPPNNMNRP